MKMFTASHSVAVEFLGDGAHDDQWMEVWRTIEIDLYVIYSRGYS